MHAACRETEEMEVVGEELSDSLSHFSFFSSACLSASVTVRLSPLVSISLRVALEMKCGIKTPTAALWHTGPVIHCVCVINNRSMCSQNQKLNISPVWFGDGLKSMPLSVSHTDTHTHIR